jgi:hypothetical protein
VIDEVPEVGQIVVGKDRAAIVKKSRGCLPLYAKSDEKFLINGRVAGYGSLEEGDKGGRRIARHGGNDPFSIESVIHWQSSA